MDPEAIQTLNNIQLDCLLASYAAAFTPRLKRPMLESFFLHTTQNFSLMLCSALLILILGTTSSLNDFMKSSSFEFLASLIRRRTCTSVISLSLSIFTRFPSGVSFTKLRTPRMSSLLYIRSSYNESYRNSSVFRYLDLSL